MLGAWPKLTIFRLRGIPVRIDATFLLVPVFFLGGLSWRRIEDGAPLFIVGVLGVFLSILLHEIGHALAAQRYRVGVRDIVIGGFYGFTGLKGRAIPRRSLVRILAMGPLANLAIFLALWLVLSLAFPSGAGLQGSRLPAAVGGWPAEAVRMLALINLAMFAFNALPAFPLDGGRILDQLLHRILSEGTVRWLVSGASLVVGAVMVLMGLGAGLVLSLIGLMIVATNLQRLRRRPTARPSN